MTRSIRTGRVEYRRAITFAQFRQEVGRAIDYAHALHVSVAVQTPLGWFFCEWRVRFDNSVNARCDGY